MPPRKKKTAPRSTGLDAHATADADVPEAVAAIAEAVEEDGGAALATYREPFGGHWLVLAALPIDKVEPTPFQRELSEAHAKRLVAVVEKVARFLDPLICVHQGDSYWTPNGMHRLEAMKRLGAKSVVVLIVPEPEIAFRILALNTEKAHNLKDKSLEVVRMADALAGDEDTADRPESDWAFEFEEPAYLTIGRCYEKTKRFSGAAYMPVVKRCEVFRDEPIAETIPARKERAARLLALDKAVNAAVKRLKESGFDSGYLKPFVVARINPLRFKRGKKAAEVADFDATIDTMIEKAAAFDVSKVKQSDLAGGSDGNDD